MSSLILRGLRRAPNWNEAVTLIQIRHCSDKPQPKPSKYSPEAVKENVRGYVFTRYIDHVKNYDKVLEKTFPSAMRIYRSFLDGVKLFYHDMKRYVKVMRIVNDTKKGIQNLTRKELELYYQMPKDMYKVAPALFISTLPFVGYVVFPLVYMFPRALLTQHFWSLQQKSEFQTMYLQERLMNNRKVFRCLQANLENITETVYYEKWNHILGLLGSGLHPSPEEVLFIKDLFAIEPYQFSSLTQTHINNLCHMHGLRGGIFGRDRLLDRAEVLLCMDIAIRKEGHVHNMHPDDMKYACYQRGLNPVNLSNDQMIDWLRSWLKVSLSIEEQHNSLYLHLPILLGYNHPNNWLLIYK